MTETSRLSLTFVIADDHAMTREWVRTILDENGYQVIGEASDGEEAVHLCRSLQPDMAVLDLSMPRLNGIKAACEIKRALPSIKILLLTMHPDGPYILESLRMGVAGYVTKPRASSTLPEAIDAVRKGEIYLSRDGNQHFIDAFLAAAERRLPGTSLH